MAVRLQSPPAQIPTTNSLKVAREAAASCTACHLYKNATQTVFGAGPSRAPFMVVGEQPGDQEDRQGKPFVGPAGRALDEALRRAGIAAEQVYVTNAVKHFKWRPQSGKRRLHDRPDRNEIEICKPWLLEEIRLVRPRVAIALGVTAATSLLGKAVSISRSRGTVTEIGTLPVIVTYHPSSILRQRERPDRERRMETLVADLRRAASILVANHGRGVATNG